MLYLAMVHGFFSDEFLGKKGGKGKAKDLWHLWSCFEKLTAFFAHMIAQEWADLQGTRLKWMAAYIYTNTYRTERSRWDMN